MAGTSALAAVLKFTSLSPMIDPPTLQLNYLISGSTDALATATDLAAAIKTSLTSVPSGATHPGLFYLSKVISRGANTATITMYDLTGHLDGSRHGSPLYGTAYTVPTSEATATAWPAESAIVITLQAPYGTDVEFGPGNTRPRARDRGRIYLGPLIGTVISTVDATTNRTYVSTLASSDLRLFIKSLAAYIGTSFTSAQLGVWSRKNAAIKPLSACWVDDEFDTQRRRSNKEGTRGTVTPLP